MISSLQVLWWTQTILGAGEVRRRIWAALTSAVRGEHE